MYGPLHGVAVDGEKRNPAEDNFDGVADKGLQKIDAFGGVGGGADSDAHQKITEGAAEGDANGLVDDKEANKQTDAHPIGDMGKIFEQGRYHKHQCNDQHKINKARLNAGS